VTENVKVISATEEEKEALATEEVKVALATEDVKAALETEEVKAVLVTENAKVVSATEIEKAIQEKEELQKVDFTNVDVTKISKKVLRRNKTNLVTNLILTEENFSTKMTINRPTKNQKDREDQETNWCLPKI
jgi:hypothetical protein